MTWVAQKASLYEVLPTKYIHRYNKNKNNTKVNTNTTTNYNKQNYTRITRKIKNK